MKKLLLIPLIFGLTACQSTYNPSVAVHTRVVKPLESMYQCPVVKKWPNPATLTDIQVAKTLVELHKNNIKCKNSIDAIKKFLDQAEKTVEGNNSTTSPAPVTEQDSKLFGIF